MARVQFTRHLQRFFPGLEAVEVEANTLAEVVAALDRRYPGLADYLIDERGALRRHVNIFIGETLLQDRERLSDAVGPESQVFVMQALSGG
jgi:sulfur-carrier protein